MASPRSENCLDIYNAITHGVEVVRIVQKYAEITVAALQEWPFTHGQIRRVKKALGILLSSIAIDERHVGRRRDFCLSLLSELKDRERRKENNVSRSDRKSREKKHWGRREMREEEVGGILGFSIPV